MGGNAVKKNSGESVFIFLELRHHGRKKESERVHFASTSIKTGKEEGRGNKKQVNS